MAQPLAPSPHNHRRVPELTWPGTGFQPLNLSGRPMPTFPALLHTVLCSAVYSSSIHIYFLE